mmetsp:Transcript_57668/g.172062  ORF Transcript_57668/g.172062 Transcript_57668/m.172062 type:complete len:239 (+) Transcript_57668:3716-4432(+)
MVGEESSSPMAEFLALANPQSSFSIFFLGGRPRFLFRFAAATASSAAASASNDRILAWVVAATSEPEVSTLLSAEPDTSRRPFFLAFLLPFLTTFAFDSPERQDREAARTLTSLELPRLELVGEIELPSLCRRARRLSLTFSAAVSEAPPYSRARAAARTSSDCACVCGCSIGVACGRAFSAIASAAEEASRTIVVAVSTSFSSVVAGGDMALHSSGRAVVVDIFPYCGSSAQLPRLL